MNNLDSNKKKTMLILSTVSVAPLQSIFSFLLVVNNECFLGIVTKTVLCVVSAGSNVAVIMLLPVSRTLSK